MTVISNFFKYIIGFFAEGTGNYALSILIVTVLIKLVLAPFSVGQVRMSETMKRIQPLQKELQEKYKDDPKEMQIRMSELYKENNVKFLSSCLGSLLPLPFLIIMYRVFINVDFTAELAGRGVHIGFLWVSSLAVADPIILPLISSLTTFLSFKQTQADKSQAGMTYIMPIVFFFITRTLPAGAALYWVISNIISFGQTYLIKAYLKARENKRSAIK